jgi:hypothetical protein
LIAEGTLVPVVMPPGGAALFDEFHVRKALRLPIPDHVRPYDSPRPPDPTEWALQRHREAMGPTSPAAPQEPPVPLPGTVQPKNGSQADGALTMHRRLELRAMGISTPGCS